MSATKSIKRLAPAMMEAIRHYATAKETMRVANATAAAAEKAMKLNKSKILDAMNGAVSAICETTVLTLKTGNPSAATLTLADGEKIDFSDVSMIIVGNRSIMRADITAIFGGRAASETLDVTGLPPV